MRKKYLKQQIILLQSLLELHKWQISNLNTKLETFSEEIYKLSQNYQTLLKSTSKKTIEANTLIKHLANLLEEKKTENITLKKENLTLFQKNEILKNQLDGSRIIIKDLNSRLFLKENKKDVKKYCSNKSEGICKNIVK